MLDSENRELVLSNLPDKVYHLHGTQSSNGNQGVTLVVKIPI